MLDGDERIENWREFLLDMAQNWLEQEEQPESKNK